MRGIGKDFMMSLLLGLVLPGILLNAGVKLFREGQLRQLPPMQTEPARDTSVALPVRVRGESGDTEETDMDRYLVGVVLAEMSAHFEEEALKAQAVVARTYARKAWVTGGKHGDGSVCTESSCCQGYRSQEEYLAEGGAPEAVQKVESAVAETSGWVLMYEGNLIEATYFSCSGGRTEDAIAVWGTDYPYLQSVESPGEEQAAHYTDTETLSADAFARLLQLPQQESPVRFGNTTYTEGGGVQTIEIGGKTFTGTQLRSLLGLRSTAFTMEIRGDSVIITTKGYGHRVGMSQYGADAMAVSGCSWREILSHYYSGAEAERLAGV